MASSRSLLRHGSILSLLTLASRVLGLIREMVKARLLGTSSLSDAFSVAFMIPNLFRRLFAEGSISVAFIPTFKAYLLDDDTKRTREFLSAMFTFLSFFVSLAVGAGMLAAPRIVPIFGMEAFDETVLLTRIMFPFLAFISIAALFQGILNSLNVFTPSGLAPILLNLSTIFCALFLGKTFGNSARAMAVGILLGGFLEAAVQFPFILRRGWSFRLTSLAAAVKNPGVRQTLRLVGPTIIGMAAYQINDLVATALAGNAGEGVVSSLQFSQRLQELILGVFAVSIGTVLLPDLAEMAKQGRWERFNSMLAAAMNIIALITVPITFFGLAQGEQLIRLLFQSQRFGEESVALTLTAFHFHIAGLLFIALNRILAPAFYAQSDSASPTKAGIISFAANIVFALALVGPMKGGGIALAISLSSLVNTVLLLLFLSKNPRLTLGKALKNSLLYVTKLCAFSLVAAVPVRLLSPKIAPFFADHGKIISLGIPLFICALMYGAAGVALLALFRDPLLLQIVRRFRRAAP